MLHNLVNNLTAKRVNNSLPPNRTDAELANDFAEFFENKILTIREMFTDIPQYESTPMDVPRLSRFTPMTVKQVEL